MKRLTMQSVTRRVEIRGRGAWLVDLAYETSRVGRRVMIGRWLWLRVLSSHGGEQSKKTRTTKAQWPIAQTKAPTSSSHRGRRIFCRYLRLDSIRQLISE